MDLLSQIAGAYQLRQVWVRYPLLADLHELEPATCLGQVHHDFVTDFHRVLAQGVLARLPENSAELTVALGESSQVGKTAVPIASFIRVLFQPWMSSGVMKLVVDENHVPRWDDTPAVDLTISSD